MDPTSVNRKRNVSTSSVPHQIALNPVQEETSENENSDDETDEESLGAHRLIGSNTLKQLLLFECDLSRVRFLITFRTKSGTQR